MGKKCIKSLTFAVILFVYILDLDSWNEHFCSKGKVIPFHAFTGPEGSRRLKLP
jgi:hypothetical protein